MSDKPEPRDPRRIERRTVRVRPQSYQPSKAALEEDVSIDATPEDLIRAAFQPAHVVEDPES